MRLKSKILWATLSLIPFLATYLFAQTTEFPDDVRFLQRVIVERRTSDRTPSTLNRGAIWYDEINEQFKGNTASQTLIFQSDAAGGHDILSENHGDTVNITPTQGQILEFTNDFWRNIGPGAANTVFGVDTAGIQHEYKTLTGQTGQIIATHSAGNINFSLETPIPSNNVPDIELLNTGCGEGEVVMTESGALTCVIGGSTVTAGITASTPDVQGGGPLTSTVNHITTVPVLSVVTLPPAIDLINQFPSSINSVGRVIYVFHDGLNTLKIYPAVGDNLGAGLNIPISVGPGSRVAFIAVDDTNYKTATFGSGPVNFNVADLPTTWHIGGLARLRDGDAAGATVVFNGTEWHCLVFYISNELNATCPPWNIVGGTTDQSTKVQAWLDDYLALQGDLASTRVKKWYLQIEDMKIELQSPVSYIDDDITVNFTLLGRTSAGSRFMCNTGEGNPCFTVGNTAGTGNVYVFRNLGFEGRSANSSTLLDGTSGWAQALLENVDFGNYANVGLDLSNNAIHPRIIGGACGSSDSFFYVAAVDPTCILVRSGSDVLIKNLSFEQAAGGDTKGWVIRAEVGSSGVMQNFKFADIRGSSGHGIIKVVSNSTANNIISITGISGTSVDRGIDVSVGSALSRVLIADSSMVMRNTAETADRGIVATGGVTTIRDNYVHGFDEGIRATLLEDGSEVVRNVLENINGICVNDRSTVARSVEFRDNKVIGGCGSGTLFSGLAAGSRVIGPWNLVDAASRDDVYAGTLGAADAFILSKFAQEITIADSGDGNPGASTENVWSQRILLTNADPHGGNLTLSAAQTNRPGMRLSVVLVSTAGGVVTVTGAAADTITVDDVFTYERHNSQWRKIN